MLRLLDADFGTCPSGASAAADASMACTGVIVKYGVFGIGIYRKKSFFFFTAGIARGGAL
jgi:hypothetical protein